MDRKTVILAFALQNAQRYGGKTNPGAVIGKVVGELKLSKEEIPKLAREVQEIITHVNGLSIEQQAAELSKIPSDFFEVKEEHELFDAVPIQPGQKVITAFPPEPSKYPHIGHAKAILLNYELARRNKGRFILRFEDTNPELAKEEFYKIHLENYSWLGIEPDEVINASEHLKTIYDKLVHLIKEGHAYVCSCPQEAVKASREKGEECEHRGQSPKANLELFEAMKDAPAGSCIVRAKIDLKHKNSTMRDPTLMRIVDHPHPITGTKYRLWPTYDFENAVMDGVGGITHRLRTKEFEMRNELQRHLQSLLELPQTAIFEFARFNLEGVESSGRIIREKIANGELSGWDDPSLTTLVALRKRGFLPEAIKSFVLSTGITKNEATLTWDDLYVHNRRLLDEKVDRYTFIAEPKAIVIKGAPHHKTELTLNPYHDHGKRTFSSGEHFIIPQTDFGGIEEGHLYRLLGCLNFEKKGDGFHFVSTELEEHRKRGQGMISWLPDKGAIAAKVLMPDHRVVEGMAEPPVDTLAEGTIVQFERFGFCRLVDKGTMTFWFTHP